MALTTVEQTGDIERFTSAVKEGNISRTRDFLKTYVTLVKYQDRNHKYYTPLHWAAEKGNTGIVEVILEVMVENNISLDAKEEGGETALHIAAQNGHLDTMNLLILNGAKADAVDNDGYTALHWAAQEGHVNIAEKLLMSPQAIDINCADNDHNTPLHLACQESKLEIVNLLLEKGADVSTVGEHGYIPLHWAAQEGYIKIASVLLKHNSSLSSTDHWNNTPLHLAARKGHVKTARYLVKKGANLKALEEHNKTPLQLAEQEGHTKVAEILRLIAFKRKRKEFDREFGNDDDGGIKKEIEEELFKIKDVVAVGSGVNKEWRETGKYGGLCILVKVSIDPNKFKADYPKYKNEPYFIRQCGTKFVNECGLSGSHITTASSNSRGTVGLMTSNESNNSVLGITAFHVLHPGCEENNGIDEDTYNTCQKDLEEYNCKGEEHWLSDAPYYVNEDTKRLWSFTGGKYDCYLDVGVVGISNESVSYTKDFEWPNKFKELKEKDFHKVFENYEANERKEIVVYHNGFVSGVRSHGELVSLKTNETIFLAKNGEQVQLKDQVCVTAVPDGSYSKQVCIRKLEKYFPNLSESEDSSDNVTESEGEDQSDPDITDDDVVFREEVFRPVDENYNPAEGFTSPGDSGGIYYIKLKGTDKVYKAPIAVHRCQRYSADCQTECFSYGSRFDKVLHAIEDKYDIEF